jgi:hypothetical protein
MSRIRPLLLAVALAGLVLAPVASATPALDGVAAPGPAQASADTPVRNVENTTNVLDIEQEAVERGDYGEASLDVGAAIDRATTSVGAEHSRRAFERRYADAGNESERTVELRREVDRLDRRVEAVERRQQRAIARYNDDELAASELLRELAAVDAAARQISVRFEHLRDRAGFSLPAALDERIDGLESRLVALRGPVRARLVAATAGRAPATTAYAVTSADAVVLGTTDGTQFYREAHLPDNYAAGEPNQFVTDDDPGGITGANERGNELYPWAYADAQRSLNQLSGSVYRVTLDHSQGTLESYLDGSTRSVFHEVQTLRVDRLPTSTTTNETSALVLRVNRTYGTGPMAVRVVDATTGRPVDATVRVNGYPVGTTGADGSLWTTTPHRQASVVAEANGETVAVTFFGR